MVRTRTNEAVVAALLAVSACAYWSLGQLNAVNGWRPVLLFLACMAVLFGLYATAFAMVRRHSGPTGTLLILIFCGAALFRMMLLPAGLRPGKNIAVEFAADLRGGDVAFQPFLLFDSDVWRYLWDGHVWAHGINPYRHAAGDPALKRLASGRLTDETDWRPVWSEIRSNVPFRHLPTVYPPAAQVLFRLAHLIAPGSVLAMKLLIVALDLAAVGLLMAWLAKMGVSPAYSILYAWNPLAIKVFAGSAHYDALVVFLMTATGLAIAAGRRYAASVCLGVCILAKLSPLVLLPMLYRQVGWRGLAVCGLVVSSGLAAMLPTPPSGLAGFVAFGGTWQFNAGPFALLYMGASALGLSDPELVARTLSAVLAAAFLVVLYRSGDSGPQSFAQIGGWAVGGALLLSPVVNPWYVTWLLPFAAASRRMEWFWISAFVCLAFLTMVDGRESGWAVATEYALIAFVSVRAMPRASLAAFVSKGSNN